MGRVVQRIVEVETYRLLHCLDCQQSKNMVVALPQLKRH